MQDFSVAHTIPFWKNGDLWLPMQGFMEDAPEGLELSPFSVSVPLSQYANTAAVFFNFSKYLRDEIKRVREDKLQSA
jgi:hypothetical protein